jgi:hypothetical protein
MDLPTYTIFVLQQHSQQKVIGSNYSFNCNTLLPIDIFSIVWNLKFSVVIGLLINCLFRPIQGYNRDIKSAGVVWHTVSC